MNKGEKGITLIALVIAIIILLILAGVSISMLTGENGILTQANNARLKTEEAREEEERNLEEIGEYLRGYGLGNENTRPNVPEGAIVLEGNLETGIVIKDINNNEWVWVEVPKSIFTATSDKDYQIIENDMIAYVSDYRTSYTDTWISGFGITQEEYRELKEKMLSKIYKNGGFWISRYEVGTDTIRLSSSQVLSTPISQQDVYVYNYVTVGQAQTLASQMSSSARHTSSLIFGIQWDLTMKYIESKGVKTQAELNANSTSWGNYWNAKFDITRGKYSSNSGDDYTNVNGTYTKVNNVNILLTTGATKRNEALNIYDIAGNVFEWTLESDSVSYSVVNGGYYYNNGSGRPASNRHGPTVENSTYNVGFRATLM